MAKQSCQKICQHIYGFRTFEPAEGFNRDGLTGNKKR